MEKLDSKFLPGLESLNPDEAFQLGYFDYIKGVPNNENPFKGSSPKKVSMWTKGWQHAESLDYDSREIRGAMKRTLKQSKGEGSDPVRKFIVDLLNYQDGDKKVEIAKLPQKETDIKKDRPEYDDSSTTYMYRANLPNKLAIEIEMHYDDDNDLLDCYAINGWDNSTHGQYTFEDISDVTEAEKSEFVDFVNGAIKSIKEQGSGKFGAHSDYEIKSIDELDKKKLDKVLWAMWETLPDYGSGYKKSYNPTYADYETFAENIVKEAPQKVVKWVNEHQWALKNSIERIRSAYKQNDYEYEESEKIWKDDHKSYTAEQLLEAISPAVNEYNTVYDVTYNTGDTETVTSLEDFKKAVIDEDVLKITVSHWYGKKLNNINSIKSGIENSFPDVRAFTSKIAVQLANNGQPYGSEQELKDALNQIKVEGLNYELVWPDYIKFFYEGYCGYLELYYDEGQVYIEPELEWNAC